MLLKKLGSMKKLAKKVKSNIGNANFEPSYCECLIRDNDSRGGGSSPTTVTTRTGTFPVYVGEHRQRFIVPMGYLSHPLFKMMLEKAYDEFGFYQRSGLVIPCSVAAFQEVISVVECCNGKFYFGDWVQEFI